jgi:hypothetical protein
VRPLCNSGGFASGLDYDCGDLDKGQAAEDERYECIDNLEELHSGAMLPARSGLGQH